MIVDRKGKLNSTKRSRSLSAFTIVELLIVIVIIAILAAITIVTYTGIQNRARSSALQSNLSQMAKGLEVSKVANSEVYPSTLTAANIKVPDSGAYNYQTNGSSYCLSATNAGISYKVSNTNSSPAEGTCSGILADGSACPTGFIVVPGNSTFGTSDFCVMKYEAKIAGQSNGNQTYSSAFVPESRADGTPWVNITQTNAIAEASTVSGCTGCHLMTEAEWMTLAANVLSVPSNWSGGTVGSGYIYSGHNDNSPASSLAASTDDTDGYNGTGNSSSSSPSQRRTLTLTNGEVVWDLAGNVNEWTSQTITTSSIGISGDSAFNWRQWNLAGLSFGNIPTSSLPSALASLSGLSGITGWTSTQGIGQLYANYADATSRAFIRGGNWGSGSNAGVLTLNLSYAPSSTYTSLGFRVAR